MFAVEKLHWLAGAWIAEYEGRRSEEFWLPPIDGSMLGVSRTSRSGIILFEEQMRIGDWNGTPGFAVAHSLGDPAEFLELLEQTEDQVLFGNSKNPEAIHVGYYRTEAGMEAKVFGNKDGRTMDLKFSFVRNRLV